jgi:hypothetical protein
MKIRPHFPRSYYREEQARKTCAMKKYCVFKFMSGPFLRVVAGLDLRE